MRMRTRLMVCLGLLLIPGAAWSMQESPAGSATEPNNAPTTRIYTLRHYPAEELAHIIEALMPEGDVGLVFDNVSNRLIVTAPRDRLAQTENLIEALDTEREVLQARQMMCRVYMFELPSEDQKMKPFSVVVTSPSQVPAAQLLEAVKEGDLRIGNVVQRDSESGGGLWSLVESESGKWVLLIDGRASSNDSVKRLVERIPEAQIKQLKWDAETLTPPAAQITQLPDTLQQHLRRFLGENLQTAAYWFGSLSIPGRVEAPIGPWMFQLEVGESALGEDLELNTSVVRESEMGSIPPTQILSNSIRVRIGKPVIIGYNRDSYGVRTMGAMVIIPESEE